MWFIFQAKFVQGKVVLGRTKEKKYVKTITKCNFIMVNIRTELIFSF